MSMAIALDTLKFANRLKAAGVPDKQAEAIVEAQRDAMAEVMENGLATKLDLQRLETRLEARIEETRRDLREMELRLKDELTLRLGGMMAASVAIIVALNKLL